MQLEKSRQQPLQEAGIASPCVAVDYIQATEVTEGLDTVRDTLAFGYAGKSDSCNHPTI